VGSVVKHLRFCVVQNNTVQLYEVRMIWQAFEQVQFSPDSKSSLEDHTVLEHDHLLNTSLIRVAHQVYTWSKSVQFFQLRELNEG
jgi:hypothetical protein